MCVLTCWFVGPCVARCVELLIPWLFGVLARVAYVCFVGLVVRSYIASLVGVRAGVVGLIGS